MTHYLPHSEMAEQVLLGCLMLDNTKINDVSNRIDKGYFFIPIHWDIYQCIVFLNEKGIEANPMTVADRLKSNTQIDIEYLKSLYSQIFGNAEYVSSIASPVYQLATLKFQREVIHLTEKMHKATSTHNVNEVEEVQKQLAELHNQAIVKPTPLPIEQFQEAYQASIRGGDMMLTGLSQWDDNIGGIFKGSRYVVAGHASVGKSAMALNVAWNMAKQGRTVRYLSFEEDQNSLLWRIMAREMRIPITSFRKGLTEQQKVKVTHHTEKVINSDFLVFYKLKDVNQMIAMCGPSDLIVIDGISAFPAPADFTKVDKAGWVMDQCQILAHRTGAAVIALSHINSDGFKHGPSFSSLYGGQAATFDPETIVELRWDEDTSKMAIKRIEGHIIKNRYGVSNQTMKLVFEGEFMEYRDA
jgi:replicative DNA helicase